MKWNQQRSTAFAALLSGMVVLASLGFEYGAVAEPCSLCLWQRGLWGLVCFLSLASLVISRIGASTLSRLLGVLRTAVLLAVLGVACYQQLLFMGVLQERCSRTYTVESDADFLTLISKKPVPCNRATDQLLGLPLPVYSFGAALLVLGVALRSRKTRTDRTADLGHIRTPR